jgi:Alginate export
VLRTRSFVAIGCLFALKCVMPPWAAAEGDQQGPISPPPRQIRVGGWTVTGNLRLRFEDWDFFKAQTGDNVYGYGASLLRVSIGRQFHTQDWLFEAAQPSLIGLPTDAVAPLPQGQLGFGGTYSAANPDRTVGIFLKQAFVRFKGIRGDQQSNLRIGRFEFGDGLEMTPEGTLGAVIRDRVANRLIGNFGFTHVQRSLDGVHFSRGTSGTNVTVVAALPTEGVFQVKGMKELNVEIVYGALTKSLRTLGDSQGRVFVTYYRDGRDVLKTDNRLLPVRSGDHRKINVTTIGGNYVNVVDVGIGKADVLFWGAAQVGTWGELRQRSHAAAAEAGYLFDKSRLKPWIRAGYFRGSGDDDPSDGTHRTFFQELPTPRPFARFPLYNLMNNEDGFAQFTLNPRANWTVRSEAHVLNLTNAEDLWYVGGGAFQKQSFGYTGRPSGGQRKFANMIDLSVDYQLNSQTTVTIYAAHAEGKAVVRNLFPDGRNANLAYIELIRRF